MFILRTVLVNGSHFFLLKTNRRSSIIYLLKSLINLLLAGVDIINKDWKSLKWTITAKTLKLFFSKRNLCICVFSVLFYYDVHIRGFLIMFHLEYFQNYRIHVTCLSCDLSGDNSGHKTLNASIVLRFYTTIQSGINIFNGVCPNINYRLRVTDEK